jgi:C1A family cysteine protease
MCLLASAVQGVFAAQQSVTGSESGFITEAPLNQEYIDYKNSVQPNGKEENKISKDQLGFIPEPADNTHLKGKKVSKKTLEAEVEGISDVPSVDAGEIVSAPATYDLRTTGRVSPVKNQGSCGSCWAFATYGSMESEALPTQLWDFSEDNLKNTHGFDYGPCAGGNSQMATAYLTRWSGAVAEAADPYSASSTTSPTGLPVQEHAQEILTIPGRSGSLDNDNIKTALQTTGALYTTMYWSNTYYNAATGAYYYSGTSGSNHAVTIVGWDDSYSKTNFIPAAPGNGAFIVKNSWGTSWGNNGYFYLSYYDSKVGKSLTAFTGESATNYNHIYQYDPLGWTSSMGYGSTTAWAANVFTPTSQEAVSAVGLSTNQINTAYQISIYTNPTQGPLTTAGPATTVQGTIGVPGYHTIALPIPVTVKQGEKFSVVVRFQTQNYNYPITIEKPLSGYSSQATASAGQSYISSTGTSWTDLTSSIPNANACLKAFTVNAATSSSAPVASFTGTPTSGVAPRAVTFTDASTNSPTSWAWTFGDDGTSTVRSPSHTYTIPGTYTVTLKATNAAGSNTLTRTNYVTVTSASVTSSITITSPNGGETWKRGTSQTITWDYAGSPGSTVTIVLMKGSTVAGTIKDSTPIGSGGKGSYTWPISSSGTGGTGSDYKVSIQSISQPTIKDTSNNYFTLTSATTAIETTTPSITVTSPNGGETWKRGTSQTITWDYTGSPGSAVTIVLMKGSTVAGTIKDNTSIGSGGKGSYTWPISSSGTGGTGSDYKVSVQSISQPTIKDTSNNYFTLASATATASITVTSPNGGETWKRGTSQTITWDYTGSPGSTVTIVLMKGGIVAGTIKDNTSIGSGGKGSYTWPISSSGTGGTGSDYKVSVQSISQLTIKDMSNNYFALTS